MCAHAACYFPIVHMLQNFTFDTCKTPEKDVGTALCLTKMYYLCAFFGFVTCNLNSSLFGNSHFFDNKVMLLPLGYDSNLPNFPILRKAVKMSKSSCSDTKFYCESACDYTIEIWWYVVFI